MPYLGRIAIGSVAMMALAFNGLAQVAGTMVDIQDGDADASVWACAVLWRKRQKRRLKIQRPPQYISCVAARASLPAVCSERRRIVE